MRESDQYAPLWKGANSEGWRLWRIADGSVGKKPCDITGVAPNGLGVCLEVKSFDRRAPQYADSPVWPLYASHQIRWLDLYAEAHALALAAEYDETRREMRLFWIRYLDKQTDRPTPYMRLTRETDGHGGQLWLGWNDFLDRARPVLP